MITPFFGVGVRSSAPLSSGGARSKIPRSWAHSKNLRSLLLALVLGVVGIPVLKAQSFEFTVRHHHTFKDCQGTLIITEFGVEYRTQHAKDGRKWNFAEIQTLEIMTPMKISMVTYEDQKRYAGKDRVFEFTLTDRKATPELSAFLLQRVKRPMVLAVLPEIEKPAYEFPVKHLHAITGASGILKIYPDHVVFQSAREGDSRVWRLSDIQRFSQPDRYRFEIVSFVPSAGGPTEVYNFQLMEDLPEGVYDYMWIRLHPSTYYPEKPANSLRP